MKKNPEDNNENKALNPNMRYMIQVVLGVLCTVFVSIWVNLLTSTLQTENWLTTVINLKWSHLFLLFSAFCLSIQFSLIVHWNKIDKKISEAISKKTSVMQVETIQEILTLSVEGLMALNRGIKINVRYYTPRIIDNKRALLRNRKIHIERVRMTAEYGLDYALIDEDKLVLCESFKQKNIIYSELQENHTDDYSKRLSSQIDPKQSWVLCCPILHDDPLEDPISIIVFYSTILVATDEEQIERLKHVAIGAAKTISSVLNMKIDNKPKYHL